MDFKNYPLPLLWSSGTIIPFQQKQSVHVLQHSLLASLLAENFLILLWKSILSTSPDLDFLEGSAGVKTDLLCKCTSEALLL